ncbi:unnamed protein product [Leptidea sinapis]|uniref:Dipeptidase n=1 Tax=Leptidea sinapis TaxID=189913 RepID=A0A5E4PQJ7_9NEOP|nr:unnamed protein product [Leptidea sinapis]
MIQVEGFNRPSPSPSRCSVRSDSRVLRQPRVIQVNRDAATMMDEANWLGNGDVTEPIMISDFENPHVPHTSQLRSRTLSDGFIRHTSLELLLGVDCEACLSLAAQRECYNKHISDHNFDLVCNCNIQHNNYVNCDRDYVKQRGHTLSTYDVERFKRDNGTNNLANGHHRSLDRKRAKSKNVYNYNKSKQFISYDPTNTLVQKIKKKLSNLKRIGGDAMSKKPQNGVQLAEIASGSSSLRKLSVLSLADKSQRRANSQTCIFSSTNLQSKVDLKENINTYENFSSNVDHCFDRLRDCNSDIVCKSQRNLKNRSFDVHDNFTRNTPVTKFSTLDNRSRCKSIKRQMSYNDFHMERYGDRVISESWSPDDTVHSTSTYHNTVAEAMHSYDVDERHHTGELRNDQAQCTCDHRPPNKIASHFYDTPPDVTDRVRERIACSACKSAPAPWLPTATTSTTSHSSTATGSSSRLSGWQRRWCCVAVLVLVAGTACVAGPLALRAPPGAPLHERLRLAERLLHDSPLIDGHNDLPWNIRKFDEDLRTISPWATNIVTAHVNHRMCSLVGVEGGHAIGGSLAVLRTLYQVGVRYLTLTSSCDTPWAECASTDRPEPSLRGGLSPFGKVNIVTAHVNHRMCSLVGVEGGHAIGGSLAVLRTLYQVGVRYLTLTSSCDTPWAECASTDRPEPSLRGGLSPFGKVTHINHIRNVAGVDYVGLGAGYDGIN